ncbi:MAG: sugar phosphate nucleotidyltransferase [Clostridia bacterium]|nr:sugar phosphate nucleotidyltransferase [Clostridia bacterium]
MKAIIMAGGEGSRLRPLTCDRPKPLTPVLNRPVMEHIINLLKKHGITEIGVTLQYLPQAIQDYFGDGSEFGVSLQYFIEETPLGTAGSVKNAGDFLDQTFLVISGDALTDFNLTRAVTYHLEKASMATLVLTRVDSPLEYGVVITGVDGAITRFLEKPSWGEVFSDTVNTGIYVLEPEVLEYFSPGQKFDFSQDLFPLLLKDGKPMYGCVLPGYWCDIGNLEQYRQAHYDILAGKVKLAMPGKQMQPGVWAEEGAEIHPEAVVEGPVFLGSCCKVEKGARIGGYSVLGSHAWVDERGTVKKGILWEHSYVGQGAQIRGAVLCNRVQVKTGAALYEGSVIGDDTVVKEKGTVKPQVKVWPGKTIEAGAVLKDSLIWGARCARTVFGHQGVSGEVNQEITPEFAAKLAAAYGMSLPVGARVVAGCDDEPESAMLHKSLVAGLQSVGVQVIDPGIVPLPVTRYGVKRWGAEGGIQVSSGPQQRVTLSFFDQQGANIPKGQERKVENNLAREDIRRVKKEEVNKTAAWPGLVDEYMAYLLDGLNLRGMEKLRLVMAYPGKTLDKVISPLLYEFDIQVDMMEGGLEGGISSEKSREAIAGVAAQVTADGADLGVVMDGNGQQLVLIDETGLVVDEDALVSLYNRLVLEKILGATVTVPVTAPGLTEQLAKQLAGKVNRSKTALPSLMEQMLATPGGSYQFALYFDGIFGLSRVLEVLLQGYSLGELLAQMPKFYLSKKEINCSWDAKGKVMRKLIEDHRHQNVEMLDGIKVHHDGGWALVLPDSEEPLCRVYGEGYDMEMAEALTEMYVNKINEIQMAEEV